jgi:hypothetical protein
MYKDSMGKIVKNKYCTFIFDSKNAYVKINNSINGTFIIETSKPNKKTPLQRLKDDEFLEVLDLAYRYKITSSDKFYKSIYNRYKLTSTMRKL